MKNTINKKGGIKKFAYTSGMTVYFRIGGDHGEGSLVSKCGDRLTVKLLKRFKDANKGTRMDVAEDAVI